ncbi:MAG: helix-turn-helix domain-containing protein [Bacteroidetes bacterium]|nr:helix-turn-helix domain-containing protein [Bacteroidota bacterium]
METTEKKILENLKQLRLKTGICQEYIAFKLKVSQSTYHKIESGKIKIKLLQFLQITEALEVDPKEVFPEDRISELKEQFTTSS